MPLINDKPQLVQTVDHGQKYLIQNGTNLVYILKVQGTPYEMGYAQGQLMAEGIKYNINEMFDYIETNVLGGLIVEYTKIPKFLIGFFEKLGIKVGKALLDLNWYIAEPYTPARYAEEMKGMSDASGESYIEIRRLNMFPELTQAACSIAGAWNTATLNSRLI